LNIIYKSNYHKFSQLVDFVYKDHYYETNPLFKIIKRSKRRTNIKKTHIDEKN